MYKACACLCKDILPAGAAETFTDYGIDCKKPFTQKRILVYVSITATQAVSLRPALLFAYFAR